eukprot:PhM_4_TR10560/c0_g1_i2/m.2682
MLRTGYDLSSNADETDQTAQSAMQQVGRRNLPSPKSKSTNPKRSRRRFVLCSHFEGVKQIRCLFILVISVMTNCATLRSLRTAAHKCVLLARCPKMLQSDAVDGTDQVLIYHLATSNDFHHLAELCIQHLSPLVTPDNVLRLATSQHPRLDRATTNVCTGAEAAGVVKNT